MLGRHFDIVVLPPAIVLLVFDAQIGEMDLVVEVRQVVFDRPISDVVLSPIRVPGVIGTVAIPLM